MATYTLVITIDSKIVQLQGEDNFNIAKKVNDEFTVTFAGASMNPKGTQTPLLSNNEFQWTEEYGVALLSSFKTGMQISAGTEFQEISFGKACVYDRGVLSGQAKVDEKEFDGSSKSNSFLLKTVPQNLHATVACKSGGKWVTIYVDNKVRQGVQNKQLTPINKFAIFWDSRIVTNTMIDYSKTSSPKEFSFAVGETKKAFRWGFASPNAPTGITEQPDWYDEVV